MQQLITINKIPEEIEQVLLGSLFGDGSLKKPLNDVKFTETHSIKQKDYLLWKKDILSNLFIFSERLYKRKNSQEIIICSHQSELLNSYFSSFYPEGKGHKVCSLEMLNRLKPLGLAIWYMDDGCFIKRSFFSCIAIHKKNAQIIKDWFFNKYNLEASIKIHKNNNGAEIIFNKENTLKLFRLIHSYIHPSMKYKIRRTKEEYLLIKKKHRDYYNNHTKNSIRYKEYKNLPELKKLRQEKRKIYYEKNKKKLLKKSIEYNIKNKVKYNQYHNNYQKAIYRKKYPLLSKNCLICNNLFNQIRRNQIYCSKQCYNNSKILRSKSEIKQMKEKNEPNNIPEQ